MLALGADGVALGKPFLVAAMACRANFTAADAGEPEQVAAGARGCVNYAIEGMTNEARMLVSSVGRYHLQNIKPRAPYPVNGQTVATIDVIALDPQVAQMFNLLYAYDCNLWDKLGVATEELRRRCATGARESAPESAVGS